jgi:aminoglycoside 6'-N-acetyltransferase I
MDTRAVTVRRMTPEDIDGVIPLRCALFDDCPPDQQRAELELNLPEGAPGALGNQACFVAEVDGALLGFAEVMLRSHAEGAWEFTDGGRMGVAYLESWFVDDAARGRGVGRALVAACEDWGRAQGSPILASDALLTNLVSQSAHEALGFEEVERSVQYRKKL